MKKLRTAAAFLSAALAVTAAVTRPPEPSAKELLTYTVAALPRAMQELDSSYGIKITKPPKIEVIDMKELQLIFEYFAVYDNDSNTIFLDKNSIARPRDKLRRQRNLYRHRDEVVIDDVLKHELCHNYFETVIMPKLDDEQKGQKMSLALVDEGTANTIEESNWKRKLDCSKFPRDKIDPGYYNYPTLLAGVGTCMVRPLVTRYGLLAINAMAMNPMTDEELVYPHRYTRRMGNYILDRTRATRSDPVIMSR